MTAREYTLRMESAKLRAHRLRREAIDRAWSDAARLLARGWNRIVRAVRGPDCMVEA